MTLSDLIAVMSEGKVVQYGSQFDIYNAPVNTYVATFIGKPRMSLVPGTLERHADSVDFVAPDLRLTLGSAAAIGLRDGDYPNVLAGLRAEHVSIAAEGSSSPLGFKAQVELIEPTGSDTFVELNCADTTVVARVAPDLPVTIGDRVQVEVKPGSVHLFDAASGERIAR